MQQLRVAPRFLAHQRAELLVDRLRLSTRESTLGSAQFLDFLLGGHEDERRGRDAVETHELLVLHLRSVVVKPRIESAEAVQVLPSQTNRADYQAELFQLRNGHVLRQNEPSPQLFVLNHQSEIGVAIVDLRHDLAVADFQKGKQGERGTDEFAAVVQRNRVRWAELNVAVLRNSIPLGIPQKSAQRRESQQWPSDWMRYPKKSERNRRSEAGSESEWSKTRMQCSDR